MTAQGWFLSFYNLSYFRSLFLSFFRSLFLSFFRSLFLSFFQQSFILSLKTILCWLQQNYLSTYYSLRITVFRWKQTFAFSLSHCWTRTCNNCQVKINLNFWQKTFIFKYSKEIEKLDNQSLNKLFCHYRKISHFTILKLFY